MSAAFAWLHRPGLAGGIDKTGETAGELLAMGFGSVEFGSVTVAPLAGSNPGLAALIARLAILGRDGLAAPAGSAAVNRKKRPKSAIGIGLGLPPELPAEGLADQWLEALHRLAEGPAVADYLSLNLSAAANRRFLGEALRDELLAGLRAVAGFRRHRPAGGQPRLAVKLPVAAVPGLWPALRQAGVEQLTVVLPDGGEGLAGLRPACQLLAADGGRVVAVGGIRSAADYRAALAAGASGVQVHRLFVAEGAATVARLVVAA